VDKVKWPADVSTAVNIQVEANFLISWTAVNISRLPLLTKFVLNTEYFLALHIRKRSHFFPPLPCTIGQFVVCCFTKLPVSGLCVVEWCDDWWRVNWKGFGRSGIGLIDAIFRNVPGVTEDNHEQTRVRTACVPAEIRTQHLPITSPERYETTFSVQ
jgi:hypothetical protein